MCYPGHTGDGIMAVLVRGALQVSVIRIPRKVAFLVSRDRHHQGLSLLSSDKTVILGRSWRQGRGCNTPRTHHMGIAGPALLVDKSIQPTAGRSVCQTGISVSFGSMVPEKGRRLLGLAFTFNVRGNPNLRSQQCRVHFSPLPPSLIRMAFGLDYCVLFTCWLIITSSQTFEFYFLG